MLSQYTPVAIQSELYLKPIPKSVGTIQCTIYRESGMMSSSFYLKLSDSNTEMLKAEKVMQSTTKHYKIKIDTPYMKYTNSENELYIGRLRANFSANSFFFYDYGMNAKDTENRQKLGPGQFIRRQLGTALYMKTDRMGNKAKHIEVYVPEAKEEDQIFGWPDTDNKKLHIYNEYQEQKASGIDINDDKGFELVNRHATPEMLKTLTARMTALQSLSG